MHIPAGVQRDLRALTDALDGPDADLSGSITALASSARLAVESFLGMALLIASGPRDIVLTAYDDGADPAQARTSLFLASPPTGGAAPESIVTGVVLYARVPGAFVDLAADARWLDDTAAVSVDQHLPAPTDTAPSTLLGDRSTVNQALGVLLARGATLEEAAAALEERARAGIVTVVGAAQGILAELESSPPED